jgi:hypothetical protein
MASGLPCQDAVRVVGSGTPGEPAIAAIADGHGHRRHFRSDTGAWLAVRAGSDVAARYAPRLGSMSAPYAVEAAARTEMAAEVLDEWTHAVAADVAARPFADAEQAAIDAAGDLPVTPYGATLLVAMAVGRWLVLMQIGDGDAIVIAPDGEVSVPVPSDPRNDGVRTTSLCQPDAIGAFRAGVRELTTEPVLAVLLATDGYGNAQAAQPWQPAVAADLARLLHEEGAQWVAGTTLALLVDTGLVGSGPARP